MAFPRRRLLSTEALDDAAREIAKAARDEGVPIAAGGGYAMQAYGSDRLTADLDVVALRSIRSLETKRRLAFGGSSSTTQAGVPVDVIVRDDVYARLYRAAVRAAKTIPGVPIRVVPAPYLVAMKMAASRPKDEIDSEFLLGRMSTREIAETRAVLRRYLGIYAAEELDGLVEEARWRRSRSGGDARRRRRHR
jgi:hypothetical protein